MTARWWLPFVWGGAMGLALGIAGLSVMSWRFWLVFATYLVVSDGTHPFGGDSHA